MVILASFILDLFFSVSNSNYIASAVSRPCVHLWWMHNCVARLPTTACFHLALSMFVNQLLVQERKKWRLLSAYIYYKTLTGEKCNTLFPARSDSVRGGTGTPRGVLHSVCARCSTSAVVRNRTCLEHRSNTLRGECLLERLCEDKIFMDLLLWVYLQINRSSVPLLVECNLQVFKVF